MSPFHMSKLPTYQKLTQIPMTFNSFCFIALHVLIMSPFRLCLIILFFQQICSFFRYNIYSSSYSLISSWQTLLQVQQHQQQHQQQPLPQSFRISPPHQLLTLQLVKNPLHYLQTGRLPRTLMERYTTIIQ